MYEKKSENISIFRTGADQPNSSSITKINQWITMQFSTYPNFEQQQDNRKTIAKKFKISLQYTHQLAILHKKIASISLKTEHVTTILVSSSKKCKHH